MCCKSARHWLTAAPWQLHAYNRRVWRRPTVVFQVHTGDNCLHCYRLHYPRRRPAQISPLYHQRQAGTERSNVAACVLLLELDVCQNKPHCIETAEWTDKLFLVQGEAAYRTL